MKNCQISTIEKIEAAFAFVPPPAKWFGIYTAEARDDYRDPTTEERTKDIRMTWQMVQAEDINSCTTALSHLKPDGWHHFIPAFMRWTIQYHDDPKWKHSDAMDCACFSLSDRSNSKYDFTEYIEARHGRLTILQIEAVIAFLQCYYQEYVDFHFDQLYTDLHYWYERYTTKGGELTKETLLWLLYD